MKRLIVGSCAMFDAESPYAQVLGKELTNFLAEEHVMGDFLVLLAAAGGAKVKLIRQVLEAGLCNALITDDTTAKALL